METEAPVYLPWNWTITAISPSVVCPSPSATLGAYVGITSLTSVLSLALAHRRVIHFVSFGYFGGDGESHMWKISWMSSVAAQFIASLVIIKLINDSKSYKSTYPSHILMLLLLTRPRLSFLFLLGAYIWSGSKGTSRLRNLTLHLNFILSDINSVNYGSAAFGACTAELLLQIPTLYIYGTFWHYGDTTFGGFDGYFNGVPNSVMLMYKSTEVLLAMNIILTIGIASCVICMPAFFCSQNRFPSQYSGYPAPRPGEDRSFIAVLITFGLLFFFFASWWLNWMFWASFLRVAGDSYCNPKLITQSITWILFSSAGSFFAGFF